MTLLERKYQKFLDEIGWEDFEPTKRSYFFEELHPEPGEPGVVLQILPCKDKKDYMVIKDIESGASLEIQKGKLKEFRTWMENNHAHGEDGAAYYAWLDAIDKERERENRQMSYEYDRENAVLLILKRYYSHFSIARNVTIECQGARYRADFVVYDKDDIIRLIIEVKGFRSINPPMFNKVFGHFLSAFSNVTYILTDSNFALVLRPETPKPEPCKFIDALNVSLVTARGAEEEEEEELNVDEFLFEVKQHLHRAIEHVTPHVHIENKEKYLQDLHEFIEGLQKSDIESDKREVAYIYMKDEAELRFFQLLLGTYDAPRLIKFCSARTIDNILQYKTMNMCSLICMNDPSEGKHAQNIVMGENDNKNNREEDEGLIPFIISGCSEENIEDLTMWRLYADDAKGVVLVFDIIKDKLTNSEFYLAPISYADKDDVDYKLEILHEFVQNDKSNWWRFKIKNWSVWKHFFKKYIYSVEKEVRLLYIPKDFDFSDYKHWFNDDRTSIHSEKALFDLTDDSSPFPLMLYKVILGVKFPNLMTNVKQYTKHFSAVKDIKTMNGNTENIVSPSAIKDYR